VNHQISKIYNKDDIQRQEMKEKILFRRTFVIFLLLSLILFLEGITSDPFQKIIIAPLGEEPFKLFIAFLLYYEVVYLTRKRPDFNYMILFKNIFVYFAMLAGIIFGMAEFLGGLSMWNIMGHFSTTTIVAIFIVIWYDKIRYPYKYAGMVWVSLGMLLHSIANQYANLDSVTASNDYLVCIAKFLKENTPLTYQHYYTAVIYYFALALFIIYFYFYTFPKLRRRIR